MKGDQASMSTSVGSENKKKLVNNEAQSITTIFDISSYAVCLTPMKVLKDVFWIGKTSRKDWK